MAVYSCDTPDHRYCVGTFARRTTTGTQSVAVSDEFGTFTPVLILMWTTLQATEAFTDTGRYFFGFSDGSAYKSMSSYKPDGGNNGRGLRAYMSDISFGIIGTAITVVTDRWTVTFSDGSITVNWTTNAGDPWDVHFLVLGGAGVQVAIGTIEYPSSAGHQTVSGLGIGPVTGVITMPVYCTGNLQTYAAQAIDSQPALGWTDGRHQAAACGSSAGLSSLRYQRTDRVAAQQSLINSAYRCDSTLVSVGDGRFTFDHLTPFDGIYGNAGLHYVAISGPRMTCGTTRQLTAPGTKDIPLPSTPGAVMFVSVGHTPSTARDSGLRWSIGAIDRAGHQANSWMGDSDGPNPTESARGHSTARVIVCADPAATASAIVPASAASARIMPGAVSLDWTDADATEREVLYLAFAGLEREAEFASGGISGPLCWMELSLFPNSD